MFLDLSQLPLTFLAYLEALPRCRNCRSSMREKSRWTRFAHSDDAVNLAFSDCVAALEQNLWEDAAKLLFLHAHETSPTITNLLVSPPIRYHLDFFECQSCDQQCARVTIDDKSDDDWHPRLAQLEAYKSSKSPRSNQSFASKCANLCRALLPAAKKAIQGISRYTAVLKVLGAITLFLLAGWLFTLFIRHFGF